MTTREQLDRLTRIVDSLASSVVAHDNQIEALIKVAEKHSAEIAQISREIRGVTREWQAYLKRLPPQ
jgi:hypothetical protein